MSFPITRTALYSRLSGDSTIQTAVGTYGSGIVKVFSEVAVENVEPPYIVFYLGSGLFDNTDPSNTIDEVWRISCVTRKVGGSASYQSTAESIAQTVHTLFNHKPLSISGWTNFWCTTEKIERIAETVGGVQWFQIVLDVRIRQDAN